jgi:hypothetical protein
MWTRSRFNNEYVPGLFAVSIDSYENKRHAASCVGVGRSD